VNDTLCTVGAPFPFGEIAPGSTARGQVWFVLLNWGSSASYQLYYQDKHSALSP
jgi:hypothetical protein